MRSRILLLGHQGQIGNELLQIAHHDFEFATPSREEFDLLRPSLHENYLNQVQPQIIVNAAANTAVDVAESEPMLAYHCNAKALIPLARWAHLHRVPIIHFSTDYVFSGEKNSSYSETDTPHPVNVYGVSKLAGEQLLQYWHDQILIFRVSAVFSPRRSNFVKTIVRRLQQKAPLRVVNDQYTCPTSAHSIAKMVSHCLKRAPETLPYGVYHYCSTQPLSWFEFAVCIAREVRDFLPKQEFEISAITTREFGALAQRPKNAILDTIRFKNTFGQRLPNWQTDLKPVIATLFKED